MERLTPSTPNQLANISDPSWLPIAKELVHINLLVAYPVSDAMLEIWAKTIEELAPDLTPEILRKLINRYKLGELEYDTKSGIQNILKHASRDKRKVWDMDVKGNPVEVYK